MEEILMYIVDNMENRVIFANANGIIRYLNNSAKKYYSKKGYNNLIGHSLLEIHQDKKNKKMLKILDNFYINSELNEAEINSTTLYAIRDKDGNFQGVYEIY